MAAATAALVGIPQSAGHLNLGILAAAVGLGILMPVLPFALEMLALRRMTPTAFGTLMAVEPAIGVLLGLLVLHQQPSLTQFGGITLVVLAGAAAQRGGRRQPRSREHAAPRTGADLIGRERSSRQSSMRGSADGSSSVPQIQTKEL